jgi:hypothetical protein
MLQRAFAEGAFILFVSLVTLASVHFAILTELKNREERAGELMKRVEANDAASIYLLANHYQQGSAGFQQDHAWIIWLAFIVMREI